MSEDEAIPPDAAAHETTAADAESPTPEAETAMGWEIPEEISREIPEDAPMQDLHPPHEPIHTWKAYLLHMSTIVLGLLIALGLDQGAEALHHRHQRHRLEEDIRAEAERNVEILNTHLEVNIPNLLWTRAALKTVHAAVPKAGMVDVTLPPPDPNASRGIMKAVRRVVWPVAESSGAIALLPEATAQAYASVDHQAVQDETEADHIREAATLVNRFRLETGTTISPGEQLHLSLAERDQLVTALAAYAQSLYTLLHRDNLMLLACQGVVQGRDEIGSLDDWITSHKLVVEQYAN